MCLCVGRCARVSLIYAAPHFWYSSTHAQLKCWQVAGLPEINKNLLSINLNPHDAQCLLRLWICSALFARAFYEILN